MNRANLQVGMEVAIGASKARAILEGMAERAIIVDLGKWKQWFETWDGDPSNKQGMYRKEFGGKLIVVAKCKDDVWFPEFVLLQRVLFPWKIYEKARNVVKEASIKAKKICCKKVRVEVNTFWSVADEVVRVPKWA